MKKGLKAKLDSIIETQDLILRHLKIKRPQPAARKPLAAKTGKAKAPARS